MRLKIISAFLAIIMILCTISACSEPKKDTDENVKHDPYEGMLVINEEYTVVRGETCDSRTTQAALYVKNALAAATGKEINIKTDFIKKGEEVPAKEIIVGKTSRDLALYSKPIAEGEYFVGIEDERIVINAYDSTLLYFAVQSVVEAWLSPDAGIKEDGVVVMNSDICNQINGLSTSLDSTITVLSQNLRYNDEGNGNNIDQRAPRFEKLVEEYKPDIMGLQESTPKWNQQLNRRFGDEYGMVGCSRDGKNTLNGEWNYILYRLDRFELVEGDTFWLTETPEKPGRIEGSTCNRICNWALLKDKKTDKTVLMINTHLDVPAVSDVQAKVILAKLGDKIAKYPTFATGDFNFKTWEPGYAVMTEKLGDAMKTAFKNTSKINYTYNGFGTSSSHIIDYIFHSELATPVEFYIANDMYDGYISDHFGILSKFAI